MPGLSDGYQESCLEYLCLLLVHMASCCLASSPSPIVRQLPLRENVWMHNGSEPVSLLLDNEINFSSTSSAVCKTSVSVESSIMCIIRLEAQVHVWYGVSNTTYIWISYGCYESVSYSLRPWCQLYHIQIAHNVNLPVMPCPRVLLSEAGRLSSGIIDFRLSIWPCCRFSTNSKV